MPIKAGGGCFWFVGMEVPGLWMKGVTVCYTLSKSSSFPLDFWLLATYLAGMNEIKFNELIEDIAFLRDKADSPLVKVAYNMANEVVKIHIEKWAKQVEDLNSQQEVLEEMYADLQIEVGKWIEFKEGNEIPDYDEYVLWAFEDGNMLWDAIDKDGSPWLYGGEFGGFEYPRATHYRKIKTPAECEEIFNIK